MSRKTKTVLGVVLGLVMAAAAVIVYIRLTGGWDVHLYLEGDAVCEVPLRSEYTDSGAKAYYGSSRYSAFRKDLEVTSEGSVDTSKPGEYVIEYSASRKKISRSVKRTVRVVDVTPPVITLTEKEDYFTRPVDEYVEEGFEATDDYDGDITDKVVRTDNGNGCVYYEVSDSSGNKASVERKIKYDDRVPPTITLLGETILKKDPDKEYEEPGFKAEDDCDGDITDRVKVSAEPAKDGNGTVYTYTVEDSYGNTASAERLVVDRDVVPPVISLKGEKNVKINAGEAYTDAGATAKDDIDGDISENIVTSGKVNIYLAGTYKITYTVKDAEGNETSAEREVEVVARPQPEPSGDAPTEKVVYLTFDDGPGRYTQKLLDILEKYNVKATFFVTNQFPGYQGMIAKEAAAGHTVAIHTYSHVWREVYSSEEGYFADLNKMNDIIEAQTGKRATILRFPGGSSNLVSNFNPGIMTRLTKAVTDMGYVYYDWNVSSGDAGGTTVTSVVVSNVINGIKNHKVSVVLQHDIKGYSVDAVEQIITWGLANGYTFLPLQEDSAVVHSRVNN